MSVTEVTAQEGVHLSDDQTLRARMTGATIAAYLKAAKELLVGRLSHLKEWAPSHLAEPGAVLVACCDEGVVVRYEVISDAPRRVYSGWMPGTLAEIASLVSQKLIRIGPVLGDGTAEEDHGTELQLMKTSPTGERTLLATTRIWFETSLPTPLPKALTPLKPFCLLSVQNTLEFQLLGEMVPSEVGARPAQPFLIRSAMRLPVGWQSIEIFPGFDPENWKPENAPLWAENDILGGIATRQFQEAQFNTLDPKSEARRQFHALFESYQQLLESDPHREEVLQSFLAGSLCPAFTQCWPKLALGAHVTDFVFREAAGDYLLVELEKAIDPLFVKSGHASHQLTRARGQVLDWRRYLEDNLATVQRELGLQGISPNPKCLIVIGRNSQLSDENRRKLRAIENESPSLKIMTYDDILSNAKAVVENLLGPLWNLQGNTQIYYLPPGTKATDIANL